MAQEQFLQTPILVHIQHLEEELEDLVVVVALLYRMINTRAQCCIALVLRSRHRSIIRKMLRHTLPVVQFLYDSGVLSLATTYIVRFNYNRPIVTNVVVGCAVHGY